MHPLLRQLAYRPYRKHIIESRLKKPEMLLLLTMTTAALCSYPVMQEARQRQEALTPEPDIVVELEKENAGFGLPSHSAMSNHLQPFSPLLSQGTCEQKALLHFLSCHMASFFDFHGML